MADRQPLPGLQAMFSMKLATPKLTALRDMAWAERRSVGSLVRALPAEALIGRDAASARHAARPDQRDNAQCEASGSSLP